MLNRFFVKIFLSVLSVVLTSSLAQADTFVLRDGQTMKGKIIAKSDTSYLIASSGKQKWVSFYQIKKMVKDPTPIRRAEVITTEGPK